MLRKALKDGNFKNKQLEYKADPKKKEQDERRRRIKDGKR